MQRIAAPMPGGMLTAPLLSMLVVPVVYLLLRRRGKCIADRRSDGSPVAGAVAPADMR